MLTELYHLECIWKLEMHAMGTYRGVWLSISVTYFCCCETAHFQVIFLAVMEVYLGRLVSKNQQICLLQYRLVGAIFLAAVTTV